MILNLFYKQARSGPMTPASRLVVDETGIVGAVPTSPIRHLLIVPATTLREFNVRPGDLRENLIIDDSSFRVPLHDLPSGTVLAVNGVRIRLTVHCEPCGRLAPVVKRPKAIEHRRGYLGRVTHGGVVALGDSIRVLGRRYQPIPYDIKERIVWFLRQQSAPVEVVRLVSEIGLSSAYCRAIPRLTKGLGIEHMITFNHRSGPPSSVRRVALSTAENAASAKTQAV